ncbi:RDD family protein [Kiritimatiellota bacterium B12222]|nr:RDD family protein [Kiritimatiellota bacterium B12222]
MTDSNTPEDARTETEPIAPPPTESTTTENVETEYIAPDRALASVGNRVLAALIDVIIANMFMLFVGARLGWLIGLAYMLTRDALPFLDGQSLGKKLMKLQAVMADTNQALTGNWAASATRNIPFAVPFFPLVEFFILLNNKQSQRLGDQWAKTKVVVTESTPAA